MKIPEGLMPPKEMHEMAEKTDKEFYPNAFQMVLECGVASSKEEAIEIIAEIMALKIALQIGSNLSEYDIKIIKGVIERHVAGILSIE